MIPADKANEYPTLARARYAQIVLAFIALFSTMDLMVVGLLIEPMKHDLGLTDIEVGLAQTTAFYAAYGLFAIPAGMLVDRFVRVRLLLAAMVLWCGSLVLVALSHDLWLLASAKTAMGLANAITYPAAMSLLADNFTREKRAFGTVTYAMGQELGGAGALLVGGLGYSALAAAAAADPQAFFGISPWRAVSLIFACVGLLLIPAVLALREPARMEKQQAGPQRGSWQALWTHRVFLIPLFIGLMALGGLGSVIRTWFAPSLIRLYGLQPGDFAVPSSVIVLLSGIAGYTLASKLMNVVRARGDEQMGMLIAAGASALCILASFMAMAPGIWGFAVLGVLFLVASNVAIAVPVIVINFRIPNELRGLCIGLYVVLYASAGMLGAPLTGYASAALGGDAMLGEAMALVATPFSLVAALSFWAASRERRTGTGDAGEETVSQGA